MAAEEEAAFQAISAFKMVSKEQQDAQNRVQQMLNSCIAVVDIKELFCLFDTLYFRSLLYRCVEVSWSKRMVASAGLCELIRHPGDNDSFTEIRIKLSEPLLKNRSQGDIVKTLLHESIHAYLFVTTSWRHARRDDGTGHGAGFMRLADAINVHGGYGVTAVHDFHDEVESFQKHVWQCGGPCKTQPPSFGIVKRATNRPPGKFDTWWEQHQKDCGGTFVKTLEPKAQNTAKRSLTRAGMQSNKLDNWLSKRNCESSSSGQAAIDVQRATRCNTDATENEAKKSGRAWVTAVVACPICEAEVLEGEINGHLDMKHTA